MPAAIAIPLIAAAVGGAATAYGAHAAGSASRRAVNAQAQSDREQREFLQRQADEDRRRYDVQIAQEKAQWDAEQARRQPFRDAASAAMGQTGTRLNNAPKPFMPSSPPPVSGTLRDYAPR